MITTAVTDAITSLAEAEHRFGLQRSNDPNFFEECYANFPPLSDRDREDLDTLRQRFLYHRQDGNLTEGTVTLLVGSPLLEIAGLYDYPFKMKGEASVRLTLIDDDESEVLKGRIDVLVTQKRLWVVILESKRTAISAINALPQALTYLMADSESPTPNLQAPSYAMVTNGDETFFVKRWGDRYDLSDSFSPFPARNRLYTVVQILRHLGELIC